MTTNTLYPLIVAVSSLTTFTTPYLIRFSGVLVKWLNNHLSENIKYLLNYYAAWVYRMQLVAPENKILPNVFLRIIINAILIAIIFSIVHFVVPRHISLFPERHYLENGVFLLIALAFSSPFIWGMLFSYRTIKKRYPLVIVMIWLLTLAEITLLSIIYFKTWIALIVYLFIALVLFIILYRHFESSYQWFERQLVSNVGAKKNLGDTKYSELAPWDTHLLEIEVGDQSPFVGKLLRQCKIREKFGINIVAIVHRSTITPAPRGDNKIFAYDKLIVLGNDEQIDMFRKQAELYTHKREIINILDQFALKPYYLHKGHSLIGKTIRASKIRETIGGLIVGLERKNKHILNPGPDTLLLADDVLLIVGEADKFDLLV